MEEILIVVKEMHHGVGSDHFVAKITIHKLLDAKYWWSTMHKDVLAYCQTCNQCERTKNLVCTRLAKFITSLLTGPFMK